MKDLCIIGAGPIGLYAAFSAGLRDIDAFVIESSQSVGGQLNLYLEKKIYDIPGYVDIQTKVLLDQLHKQYLTYEAQIPIYLNESLIKINQKEDCFEIVTDQKTHFARKVLFTHGGGQFRPRKLEGVEANNIHYHVEQLSHFKDKNVVVFGGGDAAVDWANLVIDVAKNVYLVHRREQFRAHKSSVDMFLRKGGFIYTPYTLSNHQKNGELITQIELKHKDTKDLIKLEVDEIIVSFGLIQTKTNYEDWLVETKDNLIKVQSDMSTNIHGIFACGNGVTYEGKQKMLTSGFGEVVTAIGAINFELHPEQKVIKYSSLMKK